MQLLARLEQRRARMRAQAQAGFTLVELLMTMTIGTLILGSATFIVTGAARHNNEVADRADATARGRIAMDRMEKLLRSQVCVSGTTFPVSYAGSKQLQFYADLSDGSKPIARHTFTYNTTTRTLWDSTVTGSTATPPTFTSTAKNNQLAGNVDPVGTNAIFRYYSYPSTAPTGGTALEPNVELVPAANASLSATDLKKVARIDIKFETTGVRTENRDIKAALSNQVFVRIANPNGVVDPSTPAPYDPACS